MKRGQILTRCLGLLGATLLSVSAAASPPAAQPLPVRHRADAHFALLEHEYVSYILRRFPVVATYLGGDAFDAQLANVDGTLRDYSDRKSVV